jgi:lysophospholipase L1-like esterase
MTSRRALLLSATLCAVGAVLAAMSCRAVAGPPPDRPADAAQEVPGPIRLVLPPVLYAVVGQETNVYFDNVVLAVNAENYAFDVTCPCGSQQSERWTCVPGPSDAGRHPFRLEVRNEQNAVVARAASTLEVVPAGAGSGRPVSMLIVGDSLTHASIYPQRLLDLCQSPGNPRLTLIGSHHPDHLPAANRHEGYGGWTAVRFATHYTATARQGEYSKRGSPFVYPAPDGGPRLDFARYCKDLNAGQGPDFVTIFLGPNDVFGATDETIEATIDTMLGAYDALIAAVHAVRKDTWLGVTLPVPPAASQDAFGANYACGQTRWQYKRNQHRLVERMLAKYAGRTGDYISIVPTVVNLDCRHNYPAVKAKWNSGAETEGLRQCNGVHPSAAGYRQIGDSLYAWTKARSSEPAPPRK